MLTGSADTHMSNRNRKLLAGTALPLAPYALDANPGGSLVLDVVADNAFQETGEQLAIKERLMNGFWSESDYVGVHRTWVYPKQKLSLDHYAIVEPSNYWEVLNWMQYFSSARLAKELVEAGFAIRTLTGSLTGEALTDGSNEIGVIADMCSNRERG